jgi:hypothetical protein
MVKICAFSIAQCHHVVSKKYVTKAIPLLHL